MTSQYMSKDKANRARRRAMDSAYEALCDMTSADDDVRAAADARLARIALTLAEIDAALEEM